MTASSKSPVYELPKLVSNTEFRSGNDPTLNRSFNIKNTTSETISTYSHTNGISDYLKQKIPGLGENIEDDHDRPSDVNRDAAGKVTEYSVLRAELTDIQDQVNTYLTELMAKEKESK